MTDPPVRPRPEEASAVLGTAPRAALERLVRGAVEVLPEGRLAEQLELGRPLRVKFGVDPTSPDIHLGHAVVLSRLRLLQELGHTVVLIIGDFTASVGDPSGRSALRPALSPEQIEHNALTYQDQAFRVLDRERTELRRNSEWLEMGSERMVDLLRRFTVARLLEREDFRRRMRAEQPISALELLYPVMQGYDSVAVSADLELGATDQTFNLLFGREVQESFGVAPQSILTLPILPGTDGVRKMSKTYGNYVGVSDDPDEMFGRLMSIPDSVLGLYFELLLSEPLNADRHQGDAKRELARRLVDRFAGPGRGAQAEARFDAVHKRREIPDEVEPAALEASSPDDDVHVPAVLASAFGVSRSEARRLLAQGAVRIDGEPLAAEPLDLPAGDLAGAVIQLGKRRFRRLDGAWG